MSTQLGARETPWQVFIIFLRLGLTSFGGPIAHLGFFRQEFVERRRWLDERAYADLVALCQFLPGPASSQVGLAIGLLRAGYRGSLAAWLGFTLPSALLLALLAIGLDAWPGALPQGLLHGMKIVALAVVTQAVWGMGRSLCAGLPKALIAVAAAGLVLLLPGPGYQVAVILAGGLLGLLLFRPAEAISPSPLALRTGIHTALACLTLFGALLIVLPLISAGTEASWLKVFNGFYRAGALVFGGGHVVLPLLEAEVVGNGWLDADRFLAGYGAAQAVPGPLFTFAAFLGAALDVEPSGWTGAAVALVAIFLPSFLLVYAALPFWTRLRAGRWAAGALAGINCAVVGLLLAALYDPVFTRAVAGPWDVLAALLALIALMRWQLAPWLVVAVGAGVGLLLSGLG